MLRFLLAVALSTMFFLQSCHVLTGDSQVERKLVLADSTGFYNIHVEYPYEARDTENTIKDFATHLYQSKLEDWKIGGEIYKEEQSITAAFPDRASIKYELISEFTTQQDDSLKTSSHVFTTYEYTGGANGNTTVNTFSFTKDKRKLDIQDILDFSDYKDIELSYLLEKTALSDTTLFFKDFVRQGLGLDYLKADKKTLDHNKCQCDGYFFGSNFQNFVPSKKGITFYFNKYEIAPGAAGITNITLSWEDLKPYLKPDFKF